MRLIKAALAAAALVSLLLISSIDTAAGAPAGGTVRLFVTPTSQLRGSVVVTGAIGDYGTVLSIDKNGKPDPNGNFVKVTLKRGSFELDATAINAKLNHAQPTVDMATCSASFTGTAPSSLLHGAGLYKGVRGTVRTTGTFALIGPRYNSGAHKGQCRLSETAEPLAQYQAIVGTGTIRF